MRYGYCRGSPHGLCYCKHKGQTEPVTTVCTARRTTKRIVANFSSGHLIAACDPIDIEEPFKLIAMCGKERKSIELEYLWNDYLIAVEQKSNGDRYFFLQNAKPG